MQHELATVIELITVIDKTILYNKTRKTIILHISQITDKLTQMAQSSNYWGKYPLYSSNYSQNKYFRNSWMAFID